MKKWERKNNGPGRDRTDNLLHTGQLRYHLRHWDDDFLQTVTDTNRSQFFNFPKSFHKQNILFIKQVLKQNNYPQHLIDLHIKKRLKKIRFNEQSENIITNKNKCIISLPFVKELEDFTKNFFKNIVQK